MPCLSRSPLRVRRVSNRSLMPPSSTRALPPFPRLTIASPTSYNTKTLFSAGRPGPNSTKSSTPSNPRTSHKATCRWPLPLGCAIEPLTSNPSFPRPHRSSSLREEESLLLLLSALGLLHALPSISSRYTTTAQMPLRPSLLS